jgi:hypothetical protein
VIAGALVCLAAVACTLRWCQPCPGALSQLKIDASQDADMCAQHQPLLAVRIRHMTSTADYHQDSMTASLGFNPRTTLAAATPFALATFQDQGAFPIEPEDMGQLLTGNMGHRVCNSSNGSQTPCMKSRGLLAEPYTPAASSCDIGEGLVLRRVLRLVETRSSTSSKDLNEQLAMTDATQPARSSAHAAKPAMPYNSIGELCGLVADVTRGQVGKNAAKALH